MKKTLLLIALVLPFALKAQVIDELPLDKSGMITYTDVVKTENVNAEDLYFRAKIYTLDNYVTRGESFPLYIDEAHYLEGRLSREFFVVGNPVKMIFSLKIQCREGRYKYTIYNIDFQALPNASFPNPGKPSHAEDIFNKLAYYKRGTDKPFKSNEQYKEGMLEAIKFETQYLKAAMANPHPLDLGEDEEW